MFAKVQNRQILFVFLASCLLNGCGKENIGTEASREMDREHETANVIAKSYAPLNGTYSGVVNNSDVVLEINTVRVPKDANTVPTPILEGKLVFAPRVAISGGSQRVKLSFPYKDGSYDSSSGDFSFSLEEEQRPSVVRCKASKAKVSCSMYGRMNDVDFVVNRTSDDALERLDSKSSSLFGGTYAGKTPAAPQVLSVVATFNTGFVNLSDSQMPELRVIGNFRFASASDKPTSPSDKAMVQEPMPFSDGNYDVSTGTIAMTVAGSGGPTPVNCTVETSSSIMCRWFAQTYEEFHLTRVSSN